mmetsp:Transcript_37968/g.81124  ORF Transcript_37968/g.81124 Transcript_37968/m.81124 type:complete len:1355 (+) Transcript_37968:106-4170(+)|eukprot:CAMPEP_0172533164 /NCGR_PEP_ID=MMETSP1067-20121228/5960_1 /TAXON_ID=265564 ORGANISM="Thalassiosira punctigera, Strain Tpunct2005C2" /NCGR_SAMPLE_ID=MMETSP1067 /ASSEMBLY_ACC=CAM_ASM_000444 /LENGTH=1354 /DNA_ID=CAMNT_0013317767 /DNA_START=35 /DNA_END=4099 /DNA_ORIENTATION=-
MSSNILLEDDDDAMFGDGDEEEEEEDVDMAPPPPPAAAKAAVKEEEDAAPTAEEQDNESAAEMNGDKIRDAKSEQADGGASGDAAAPPSTATAPPSAASAPSTSAPPPAASASASSLLSPLLLPTSLPSASPFPHHNAGPTSDRLRNAMSRVAADPARDAEAWGALITEAQSCYRQLLPSLYKLKNAGFKREGSGNDAEVELLGRKLDWIEACYGALLHHFPYAVSHYVQLVEILLRLSALTQDEEEQCGPTGGMGAMAMLGASGAAGSALSNPALNTPDQGVAMTPASLLMTDIMARSGTERQKLCDAKLDRIFQLCLGVKLDGSSAVHGDIAPSHPIDAELAASVYGARTVLGGLCQHSVDLWLLYVRRRSWDAARFSALEVDIPPPPPGYVPAAAQASVLHQQYEESLRSAYRARRESTRESVATAYETALERGAGFARDNHLVWKRYVNFVKSWTLSVNYSAAALSLIQWLPQGSNPNLPKLTLPPADPAHDHAASQKQLSLLRSIYQRGITHPMTGLDQFWQEYESFERSHSESLGSVLIAEWLPRYQHARSVYLERNRVWTLRELKGGRLAVPPVGCEAVGVGGIAGGVGAGGMGLASRGGAGATSTLGDDDLDAAGAVGTGATGMSGKPTSDAEYLAQMEEERHVLSRWRRRSGYERTNPERLPASDHAMRVRAGYMEEVCAFARHPEVWFEWSQWELLHGGSSAAAAGSSSSGGAVAGGAAAAGGSNASAALIAPATAGEWRSGGNAIRAMAVLSLGMESLPDSALLALAQAEILERHLGGGVGRKKDGEGGGAEACIKVLERFVDRSPTTLGFVLLQRLVRRHQGIAAARAVFSRARRTLRVWEVDASFGEDDGNAIALAASAEKKVEDAVSGQGAEVNEKVDAAGKGAAATQQRMVTNRLKTSVAAAVAQSFEDDKAKPQVNDANSNAGYITWHLYAAHATIEHRLSKNPQVAARIYELGLRKHRTFLSNPPYVLHYANLLLELNDEENLRSLLMRAVAACEEEEASLTAGGAGSDAAAIAKRREMQRPLWDTMLKFESTLSSNTGASASDILSIEARRRRALYGPSNEDVVMGGEGPPDEEDDRNLGTGVHKSSLNEQLVRVEGYDVASRIANGMGRMVDVLTVTGAIGNGEVATSSTLDFAAAAAVSMAAGGVSSDVWGDECAGGPSDVSYVKRLRFQREGRARAASFALGLGGAAQGGGGGVSSAGKLLSSRERSAGAGGAAAHAQAANAMALQNSPEWLRPLLLLLPPVPKFGRMGTVKPPPHLTEMALSALRTNPLPARPTTNGKSSKRKRGRFNDGGDSSDEENGNATGGGGYSSQFRSRQRSRLVGSGNNAAASTTQ